MRSVFARSWVARGLALILALSFGAWGIQGALFGQGVGAQNVARVEGQPVTAQEFERAYQGSLRETAESMGQQQGSPVDPSTIPPPLKREIAQSTLQQLVTGMVIVARGHALGLRVPDAALRQAVFEIPQFKGTDGTFDRQKFDQVLSQNGLTEAHLLKLVSDQLMSQAVLEPLRAPVAAPRPMLDLLYAYGAEQREMDLATVSFGSMPAPKAPDQAVLERYYANHAHSFRVPEMRRIRVVLLSRETLARDVTVAEADIRAAFEAQKSRLVHPERRSAEVVTFGDRRQADAVAAFWRGGATWASVQALAGKDGGTAVALDQAAQIEFPSEALGRAVFAAAPSSVTGPVSSGAGFEVLEVTAVTPASGSYASVHDKLRDQIAQSRVAGQIQDRVDRLQDAIAGGGLDKIPADLGAVAAEGTLDEAGNTADGTPAPLPGSDAIRSAVLHQAFSERKGAPPALEPGPEGSYFAVEVEDVIPGRPRSFAEARADVLTKWQAAETRREANERATAVYVQAKAAHALADAAARQGLAVTRSGPFRRGGANGVPASMVRVAFGLAVGDAAMVETPDGFEVGVLTAIRRPKPGPDDPGLARLRAELQRSIADDVENDYAAVLTRDARPEINADVVNRVVSP